jgi:hypothetical protein
MLTAKGLSMDKWFCWSGLVVAGLLLVLFVLDLAISFPFGGGSDLFMPIDIVGILTCLLMAYLSWNTMRGLR